MVAFPKRASVPRFEAVYQAQADWVVQTLGRLGIPDRDRDDVAHDMFVVVHRRLPDYDPTRPLRPWLFGIAYRVASDYRRRGRNRLEVLRDDGEDRIHPTSGLDARASARQRLQIVAVALEQLNPLRRAVFVMHELDGFSVPEIAEALDVPKNTLYSHLRRGRLEFREAARGLGLGTEDSDG